MLPIIQANRAFFIPYVLFLLAGAGLQLAYSQTEIFLFINARYHTAGDYFFQYLTHVGDGLFYVFVVLLLLFLSYKQALIAVCCFGASSLLAQLLKRVVFTDALRPKAFFADQPLSLHLVEGVTLYANNSFPSGHATSAFSVFCLLSLLLRQKQWGWLWFVLALLTSYSRIYLSQHFFGDIYAGSLLGVGVTVGLFYVLNKQLKDKPDAWHARRLGKKRQMESGSGQEQRTD